MSNKKLFGAELFLKAETDEYFEIEGIASTEDRDLQAEILEQDGFDLSSLNEKKMVFNDDHSPKTEDIVGIVEEARVTKAGLKVKGKVFKNNPAGNTYYNLLKHGGYVGFSVEGAVKERDSFDKSRIKRAKISAIAITRNPVNPNTYAKFCKSLAGQASLEEIETLPDTFETKLDKALEMLDNIIKGGAGSGRKGSTGNPLADMEAKRKEIAQKVEEETKEKRAKQEEDKKKQDKESEEFAENQGMSEKDAKAKEKKDKSEQKREEMKQEVRDAHERYSGDELKDKIANIKRKFFGAKKLKQQQDAADKKAKMKKSELMAELVRRANENPEFAAQLDERLSKALSSGGPAYAEGTVDSFSQGQVFQTEDNTTAKKDKKKKKDGMKNVAE